MDAEFSKFAEQIMSCLEQNDSLSKQEFVDMIPEYLNIDTCDKRKSFIKNLDDTITKSDVIEFLKI